MAPVNKPWHLLNKGDGDPNQLGPASVLRTREVADGGHLVAVPGDGKAARGECAVQDDRSMWQDFPSTQSSAALGVARDPVPQ